MKNLFYTPVIGSIYHDLDEEESKHCVRVLRLKRGDAVYLTDGQGHLFECSVEEPDQKRCRIHIKRELQSSPKKEWHLHIAIAPTKSPDRFEWFLEKSTEIGIDEITPLICDHSERRNIKQGRNEKVLISALKQSMRLYLPELNQPVIFSEFMEKKSAGNKFIAFCGTEGESDLGKLYTPGNDVLILIGPEGDFSEREVASASQNGFAPVSLGNFRLRTETAGLVACHTINLLNRINKSK